jgi:hypothetical protein
MAVAVQHTIDDAYISFRYAEQLLAGEGLVFNSGERVEGFTNPTWTLASACWGLLGVPYVWGAKFMGAAALLWALRESDQFCERMGLEGHALTWLAAACFPLAAHAVMGLETTAYAALLWVACLRTLGLADTSESAGARGGGQRVWVTATLWALCMWSRPETPLFFAWVSLALLWGMRRQLFARSYFSVLGGIVGAGVALLALRYAYYGDILPNTYYAKTGGDMLGVPGTGAAYLEAFVAAWWPWLLGGSAGALLAIRPSTPAQLRLAILAFAPIVASWFFYVQHVGGDWMLQWRFIVPAFLPLAFLSACLLEQLASEGGFFRALAWSLAAALLLHAGQQVKVGHGDVHKQIDEWAELVEPPVAWLAKQRPGSVAVGDIGWIAFATKRPIVDVIGLIDVDIARSAGGYANKDRAVIARRVFEQEAEFLIVMAGVDCTQPGYPALRALFSSPGDEVWKDYALAEVFSLGADGINCVFDRLGELGEPQWIERFNSGEALNWELEGAMQVRVAPMRSLPGFDARAGEGVLTSWEDGVGWSRKGRAVSPRIETTRRYLHFRLAGGGGPGLRVELFDERSGEVLRRVTGRGDLVMRSVYWDLRPFAGLDVRLRVVDEAREDIGMLIFDELALIDPAGGESP